MAAQKLSLKLIVDNNTRRVLFGEAEKELVDFLFSLLAFPLGYVTNLLSKQQMVGCVGSLYGSVEGLSDRCKEPDFEKDTLLKPDVDTLLVGRNHLLWKNGAAAESRGPTGFGVSPSVSLATGGMRCWKGYARDGVKYAVMDDLSVTPLSASVLIMSLVRKHEGAIVTRVVEVGEDEGLAMLRASLESKTVLTDVFVRSGLVPIE